MLTGEISHSAASAERLGEDGEEERDGRRAEDGAVGGRREGEKTGRRRLRVGGGGTIMRNG